MHLKQNILLENVRAIRVPAEFWEYSELNSHSITADENFPSNRISFFFHWPWGLLYGYEWAAICVDESAPVPVFQ